MGRTIQACCWMWQARCTRLLLAHPCGTPADSFFNISVADTRACAAAITLHNMRQ
jgi:hypothetical protein